MLLFHLVLFIHVKLSEALNKISEQCLLSCTGKEHKIHYLDVAEGREYMIMSGYTFLTFNLCSYFLPTYSYSYCSTIAIKFLHFTRFYDHNSFAKDYSFDDDGLGIYNIFCTKCIYNRLLSWWYGIYVLFFNLRESKAASVQNIVRGSLPFVSKQNDDVCDFRNYPCLCKTWDSMVIIAATYSIWKWSYNCNFTKIKQIYVRRLLY